ELSGVEPALRLGLADADEREVGAVFATLAVLKAAIDHEVAGLLLAVVIDDRADHDLGPVQAVVLGAPGAPTDEAVDREPEDEAGEDDAVLAVEPRDIGIGALRERPAPQQVGVAEPEETEQGDGL